MTKATKILEIKNRKVGAGKPKICTPLVGRTEEQLMQEAEIILTLKPDLVEWRADYLDKVEDMENTLNIMNKINEILADYPIIFTCRIDVEGGYKKLEENLRIKLIKKVIETKQIDIVDIELVNNEDDIKDIIQIAQENGVFVIISNHDFKSTPPIEAIIERLVKAENLGADIAKIAVMPKSPKDVLDLLYATNIAREEYLQIPLITMAMSEVGVISRIAGGIFGSAVTFGAGKETSAPGQIAFGELHNVIELLYK